MVASTSFQLNHIFLVYSNLVALVATFLFFSIINIYRFKRKKIYSHQVIIKLFYLEKRKICVKYVKYEYKLILKNNKLKQIISGNAFLFYN